MLIIGAILVCHLTKMWCENGPVGRFINNYGKSFVFRYESCVRSGLTMPIFFELRRCL